MSRTTKGTARANKQEPTPVAPSATPGSETVEVVNATPEMRVDVADSTGELVSQKDLPVLVRRPYVVRDVDAETVVAEVRVSGTKSGFTGTRYALRVGEATRIPIDAEYVAAPGYVPVFIPAIAALVFSGLPEAKYAEFSGCIYVTPIGRAVEWLQEGTVLGHLYFIKAEPFLQARAYAPIAKQ